MDSEARHTCLKLQIAAADNASFFVKGTWFHNRFDLSITDGLQSWICNATEEEVRERASMWDQPVTEYIELAERYLGFQHPISVYGFSDAGDGCKRLSWTFEKEGMKLEWRWKCRPSPDNKSTTFGILDFLMDANKRLSEEVVHKNHYVDQLKAEAEKCLAQSEKFTNEKIEFESATYAKFIGVLNSKKAKLRELRDQLSKQKTAGKMPIEEEEDSHSTDKTESYQGSDDEIEEPETNDSSSSKDVPAAGRGRGRKRVARK